MSRKEINELIKNNKITRNGINVENKVSHNKDNTFYQKAKLNSQILFRKFNASINNRNNGAISKKSKDNTK